MKPESTVTMKLQRNTSKLLEAITALAGIAALLLIPVGASAAEPGGSGPAGNRLVVTIEKIPGKETPRVILTAKAAERLGIETGKVSEDLVVKKLLVGGLVIIPKDQQEDSKAQPRPTPATFAVGHSGKGEDAPALIAPSPKPVRVGELWVLVTLSPGEWNNLAKEKPARVIPLAEREQFKEEILGMPSGILPVEDIKRSMLSIYYVVSAKDKGLKANSRVRVELRLAGTEEKKKSVPYSAVYYDAKGGAWVYVNTQPYTYERQRIEVERIMDDLAVLSNGPPVGTPVVTVGAAMLYGTEIFKK